MLKKLNHIHDTGAYQYADEVLSGKLVVGSLITKACERFIADTKREDIYLDLNSYNKKNEVNSIYVHGIEVATEGLALLEAMHSSFIRSSWVNLNNRYSGEFFERQSIGSR